MSGEGFITIHQAQPQPQRRPSTSGTRPVPPPPNYGGQQPVRVVNVNPPPAAGQQYHPQNPVGPQYQDRLMTTPAPQQQQQQQQQRQRQRQYAAAQPNTHVKISDLSRERPPTAPEAREALSEYFVFRYTRAEEGGYASDGTKRKPSWKRALRVEVPGITKREAVTTVRKLNKETIPVGEKKESLSEDEKRQIELTLEYLQEQVGNEWFQATLVQLTDQVKVKAKEKDPKERDRRDREREKDRRKERHRNEYRMFGATRVPSKTPSKSKHSKKVTPERISLTAYFKVAPRSNVDPLAILQYQKSGQMNGLQQQVNTHPMVRPDVGHYAPPLPQNIPPPTAADARGHGPGHHAQAYPRGQGVTIVQPAPQRPTVRRASPIRLPHRRPSPRIHHRARSPPSTDESANSETFSWAGDEDTECTSPATSYFSSGSFERRPSKPHGPPHYGIQPGFNSGKPHPQGPVYIQPHGPNERRPGQGSYPRQPVLTPAPGQGFFPTRPANQPRTGAVPPIPPSPPAPMQMPVPPGGSPIQFPPPPPGTGAPVQGHHPASHLPPNHLPPNHMGPPPPPPAPTSFPAQGPVPMNGVNGVNGMNNVNPQHPMPMPMPNPAATAATAATDPRVRQLYEQGYAAGRKEAMTMAQQAFAAAGPKGAAPVGPIPVRVVQPSGNDHGHTNRDRSRSRSRSRSRDRSHGRDRTRDYHDHGHGRRGRSRSLDRGRRYDRSRSRSHSRSPSRSRSVNRARGNHGGRRARSRSVDLDRSGRSRDWSRGRDRQHSGGGERGWERGRDRTRSRSLDNRAGRDNRDRGSRADLPRPRSGVRIVRPKDGYTRPRVGMDREGLEREMGRLRVDEHHGHSHGHGVEVFDSDDEEDLYRQPPKRTGGQYHHQYHGGSNGGGRAGTRVWAAGAAARETDRDIEMRAERVRRDEDRLRREEKDREERVRDDFIRRRDSGVDVGVPFGESNPFTPRPGLVRRKGAAYPAAGEEFITL